MSNRQDLYGYLAVLKLGQIAGYDPKLNNAARRILMILMGFSDTEGGCWPSMTKIAQKLEMTRAAVTKQVRYLEELGYLKKTAQFDPRSGRQSSNLIILNVERVNNPTKKVMPPVTTSGDGTGKLYYVTPEGNLIGYPKENK